MSFKSSKEGSSKPQSVCIDLPGESVECWRSTDKVKVILKKHRDVIFDLSLMPGKKYTVESTDSDFYYADKKKIVAGKGRQRVLFNDGERLHLWVARDFKGAFLLKSEAKLMMRVEPEKLDPKRYDGNPSTKPDPIIISLGNSSATFVARTAKLTAEASNSLASSAFLKASPMAAPMEEECAVVCVVDADLKGIPEKVWQALGTGGGRSGFADLDPNEITTRNWILGQLAGTAAFVGDNWEWLRASIDGKTHKGFQLVRAKLHYVNGKARYYFSGYSKHNGIFKPGGFGPGHDRVMSIFSGAGKLSSSLAATAKSIAATFKGNALVNFVFSSAATMAEWKNDVTKDGYDLASALLMNVIKAIIGAALTAVFVTIIVAILMFAAGASVSILAVGGVTIVAGLAAGYLVEWGDKKLGRLIGGESSENGLSGVMAERVRENLYHHWNYLKRKLLWDYEEQML